MNCCNIYELPLTQLLLGNSFHPGGLELTRQLARLVMAGPRTRVVDIACGNGDTAILLSQEFGASVIGLDQSLMLLTQAQKRVEELGIGEQVSFALLHSEQLNFKENSFDIIFCECALCLFQNSEFILNEAYRVLKPGGRLALSDVVLNKPIPSTLQSQLAASLCIAGAYSTSTYQEMIQGAGFSSCRTINVSDVLSNMVRQIEKRIQLVDVINELKTSTSPIDAEQIQFTLKQAREFIHNQGIGYSLFTARKPLQ